MFATQPVMLSLGDSSRAQTLPTESRLRAIFRFPVAEVGIGAKGRRRTVSGFIVGVPRATTSRH